MGGRGSSSGIGGGKSNVSPSLQAVWDKEEAQLESLMNARSGGRIELDNGVAYEKYTMAEMKDLLYNNNWDEWGVPDDNAVSILYKDGTTEYFSEGEMFKPKQSKANIDSVILSADYGYSVAGKNITWENYQAGNVTSDLARANKEISLHNYRVERGYEKGSQKKPKTKMTLSDYGDLHSDWRPEFKKKR